MEDPFRFLAVQGTLDMVEAASDKVLPVIPQLILPLKSALDTRTPNIICPVLKILQQMILLNVAVGQALVPYYRQILPIFNLFRAQNANLGDGIDYSQRARLNVGELILETLELFEQVQVAPCVCVCACVWVAICGNVELKDRFQAWLGVMDVAAGTRAIQKQNIQVMSTRV